MEPILGSIILFGGNFEPRGWAFCNGQSLEIAQYSALYSLLGTTYGGDGVASFNLPDLRGKVPVHSGTARATPYRTADEVMGQEVVFRPLANAQPLPQELGLAGVSNSSERAPGDMLARSHSHSGGASQATALKPLASTLSEGGHHHGALQHSLCVNYIIAVEGIYPSRN